LIILVAAALLMVAIASYPLQPKPSLRNGSTEEEGIGEAGWRRRSVM
jgi:hypothetical protein